MLGALPLIVKCILCLILGILYSYGINRVLIRIQNRRSVFQPIRDELQQMHGGKSHTPTLGGIAIVSGIVLSLVTVDTGIFFDAKFCRIFWVTLGFFFVGLVDDLIKVLRRDFHGEKGYVRLIVEILLSFILLKCLGFSFSDFQYVAVFSTKIFLGLFALVFFTFMIVGSANAMNLSDGLDGLATCLFIICIMPFTVYAFKVGSDAIGMWLVACFGACIGFVMLNMHPSRIFMGDGGSLYLGGLLGCVAVVLHLEAILFLSGAVLIVETLSVILQVAFYKLRHRRIFLMAPLHHHFELKGFSEEKVVLIFMVAGYFFSFLSLLLIL